ncbi:hypothetical protein AFLA_010139 [Aspergillus flavus NRRL3357]|nr:hypothetical protein AFLA_010139 [Aspergillus flavus NRRL3357]
MGVLPWHATRVAREGGWRWRPVVNAIYLTCQLFSSQEPNKQYHFEESVRDIYAVTPEWVPCPSLTHHSSYPWKSSQTYLQNTGCRLHSFASFFDTIVPSSPDGVHPWNLSVNSWVD